MASRFRTALGGIGSVAIGACLASGPLAAAGHATPAHRPAQAPPAAAPGAPPIPAIIAAGPDGNLWFTDTRGAIDRATPAGVMASFPLPRAGASPVGIAAGSDGNLWFTEADGNRVGRITPAGAVTE